MTEGTVAAVDVICGSLKNIITSNLVNLLDSEFGTIPIKLKTKDLKSGDIVLPWFVKVDEDKAQEILHSVEESLQCEHISVKNVTQDKHSILSFHLDRPTVTRDVLKEVHKKGLKYGHCNRVEGSSISLRSFMENSDGKGKTESPLHMRMFYILVHLKKILEASGYQVLCGEGSHGVEGLSESQETVLTNGNSKAEEFIASVKLLASKNKEGEKGNDGTVDLTSIIQRENFYVGKDGLDKNLNRAEVLKQDGKITDIVRDAVTFEDSLSNNDHLDNILHICPQGKVFRLQQMMVLHSGVSEKTCNQSYLTVGPVIYKGDLTMEQFKSSRYDQMKETSEMRHGIQCEGPEWRAKLNQLSQAGIKMEVLGTALHCPLKMDLQSGHSAENRLGAFVLYNTARLATLLRHFSQEVEKGTYPALPNVEDINFGLLREQEEWELVYLYVASFPRTVMESVEVVFPGQGKLAAKIHTHRITNFLVSFSKCLSSYYSRYHILGGPERHLLPLMFARLHLVQACLQVMTNGLHLLDIQPLAEL